MKVQKLILWFLIGSETKTRNFDGRDRSSRLSVVHLLMWWICLYVCTLSLGYRSSQGGQPTMYNMHENRASLWLFFVNIIIEAAACPFWGKWGLLTCCGGAKGSFLRRTRTRSYCKTTDAGRGKLLEPRRLCRSVAHNSVTLPVTWLESLRHVTQSVRWQEWTGNHCSHFALLPLLLSPLILLP